jgi:hypothetical protein
MSQTPFAARCSIMLLHQVRAHSMPPNKLRRRRGRGRRFGRRGNGAAQHISIGPYTPKSDRLLRCREMSRWAMYGRRPRCKRNLTFSETFGCSHVYGLFSNGELASIAMQPLWLLALM